MNDGDSANHSVHPAGVPLRFTPVVAFIVRLKQKVKQMDCESIKQCLSQASWVDVATAIAAFSAIVAAASAFLSYRLSKGIYDAIRSDEVVIAGPLHHPGLPEPTHDDCVLRCTLFNKSRRKTYIRSVEAFEQKGKPVEITWSGEADNLGNILNSTGLLGLENSVNLMLRRNDGKSFDETVVRIKHSFSSDILEILFDPIEGWGEQHK